MSFYRLALTQDDNGTFLVTSSDFPEVTTFGETREEAARQGQAAVLEAVAARIAANQPVPRPHVVTKPGAPVARLPYGVQVKVALVQALRESGITRAELSRRLNWHREQVDRLFRLDHASRPEQVEAAFAALGYELKLGVSRRVEAA
jgi:antitoxin HicB